MTSRSSLQTGPKFILTGDQGATTAVLSGDWTGGDSGRAGAKLSEATAGAKRLRVDLTEVQHLDTAGALFILRAVRDQTAADAIGIPVAFVGPRSRRRLSGPGSMRYRSSR